MLQLVYSKEKDIHQYVRVLSDPEGIRDLYWQLTRNYQCFDGTRIGHIKVLNLEGVDVTDKVMTNPFYNSTHLSTVE